MATTAARGTAGTTTGTTWASTTNLNDGAVGTNPATYATWTNATSSAVGSIEATFNFSAAIPAGSTINSVTVATRHLVNNTGRVSSIGITCWDGATQIGTSQAGTISVTAV